MLLKLLHRILDTPLASVLFAVALAVIAAQLYAISTLAQGQVQKAQLRDSLRTSENMMLAQCQLYSRGEALNACRPSATLASTE